jgi:hypothetical protein
MRLTGPVFNGNHYLTFVAFELFGTLVGFWFGINTIFLQYPDIILLHMIITGRL